MTTKTLSLTAELRDYLVRSSLRDSALLQRLRAETAQLESGEDLQIAPEQGQLMGLLLRSMKARRGLEVGTFTGYSTLVMARALPPDGQLITCDREEKWTRIAQRYWQEAGVADRIELRLGPAADTLEALLLAGEGERFDFAFLDADKAAYPQYYEQLLALLRPGGLLMIDNVLWSGAVIDPKASDPDTVGIRKLNRLVAEDPRVFPAMVPLADGLTLVHKGEPR
jgi:predicted O-methyltransferase YrrM